MLCVQAVPLFKRFPISVILKVRSYDEIGVDIFLFLSGFGLTYYMNKKVEKRTFYVNRIRGTVLPYLIIDIIIT